MTVVIAGSTGLVGSALTEAFTAAGHEVIGLNRSVIDLLDLEATKAFIAKPSASGLSAAQSELDTAAKKGLLKKNTVARRKAQLHKIAKAAGVKLAAAVKKVTPTIKKDTVKAPIVKKATAKKPTTK